LQTVRDLGHGDPWQESLERSRARRERARRPAGRLTRRRRDRGKAGAGQLTWRRRDRGKAGAGRLTWRRRDRGEVRAAPTRILIVVLGAAAILILALTGALPGGSTGRDTPAGAAALTPILHAKSPDYGLGAGASGAGRPPGCGPVTGASAYVNPLARARVKSERIDQGVDYAGSGTLVAIGTATVTYVGTSNTGWPGAFVEYRLLSGADAACYVYYAEGVNPQPGLHVGQALAAGQPVAGIVQGWPTGIEIGWGAGINTETAASKGHAWTPVDDADNIATATGKSFSALIVSLGGPPGKLEG
jgi:hypothetical protein